MAIVDDTLVAKRAHEIWESEGRPHGRHQEHWQKALAELTAARPAKATTRAVPARKKAVAAPVVVKSRKTK